MIYDKYVEINGNVFRKSQKIGGTHLTSGTFRHTLGKVPEPVRRMEGWY